MISLDNIAYILRQEAESVRRDLLEGRALTERARKHLERQVRLLMEAAVRVETYIQERDRGLTPVYDVAGPDEPFYGRFRVGIARLGVACQRFLPPAPPRTVLP